MLLLFVRSASVRACALCWRCVVRGLCVWVRARVPVLCDFCCCCWWCCCCSCCVVFVCVCVCVRCVGVCGVWCVSGVVCVCVSAVFCFLRVCRMTGFVCVCAFRVVRV